MADTDPDDEGLASRLAGAMGTGDPGERKPISLTEALYSRIVEVTRQEVSQTTEVLGEVIIQLGRLERRVTALTTTIESGPAPAGGPAVEAAPVDLSPIEARLADLAETMQLMSMRVDELAARPAEAPSGGAELATIAQTLNRGLSEVRTALLTAQPDLSPILRALTTGLDEVRASVAEISSAAPAASAPPVDLGPVVEQLDRLRAAIPAPVEPAPPVDLSPVLERLDRIEQRPDAPAVDLGPVTEVTAQWLAEVRSAVTGSLDELRARLEDDPGAGRIEQALASGLAQLQGAHEANRAVVDSQLNQTRSEITQAVASLREELDRLRVALPAPAEPVDLGPVTAAVAELRQALPAPVDLGPVNDALAELWTALPPAPDLGPVQEAVGAIRAELAGRLDELAARVEAGADPSPVIEGVAAALGNSVRGAVAGGNEDLAARLDDVRAAVAAIGARFTAKMEELRSGLADDTEGLADRIDAAAERASRPPDLTPVLDAISGIPRPEPVDLTPVLDAVAHIPRPEPVDLTPVLDAVAHIPRPEPVDLTPVLDAVDHIPRPEPVNLHPLHEHLSAVQRAGDEGRSATEAAIAGVADAIANLPRPEPVNLQPLHDHLSAVRGEASERSEQMAERLSAAIEQVRASIPPPAEPVDLTPVLDAVAAIPQPEPVDLTPVLDAVANIPQPEPTDLTPVLDAVANIPQPEPTDLTPVLDAVGQVRQDVAVNAETPDRLAALAQQLDAIERRAADEATRAAAAAEHLTRLEHSLAGVRERVSDVFDRLADFESDQVLSDVRATLERLADEMNGVRANNDPSALLEAFDVGAAKAVERLAQASEGLLARMDRRDSQMASMKVDLEQAVERSLRGLEADLAGVREGVAVSDRAARERFNELSLTLTDLRGEMSLVRTLREAIDRISSGVEGVKTMVQEADRGPELQRVASSLGDVSRDIGATRERVMDLDRSLIGLRTELSGTAEIAQASYQTADTLGALIPAVSSLENRIAAEVDELGRRIDSLAGALQSTVAALPPPRDRSATQEKVAREVGERLTALREIAAGVSEAVRNDAKKRKSRHQPTVGATAANDRE